MKVVMVSKHPFAIESISNVVSLGFDPGGTLYRVTYRSGSTTSTKDFSFSYMPVIIQDGSELNA